MPRTLVLAAFAGVLVATNWLRLEDGESGWQAALVVVVALVPALVPGSVRRRAVPALLAFLVAAGIAFDLEPGVHFPGRLLARFGGGFLDYYDVQVPFDHANHARMHGVLLLAIFAFTLLIALAAAARRPGLAALGLVVAVGWPATLLPGNDLLRGTLLLVGVLVLFVGLRREPLRGLGYAAAAGAVVVLAAGAVVAKSPLPGAAVSVVGPIADPVVVVLWSESAPVELVSDWVTVAWLPAVVVEPPVVALVALVGLVLAVVALACWLVVVDAPGIEAPPRYGFGSVAVPPTRVSKCRCGPVQLPVQPT